MLPTGVSDPTSVFAIAKDGGTLSTAGFDDLSRAFIGSAAWQGRTD
ncbi:hypothetical protein OG413_28840 [Streptomyces sp. NBC_01433]|nr:hypothetical protein [Streptomyces sp. NBC_01433]MCX4679256.1 hypothetical protein [Streptomyces sp. NBC_01433]